VPKNGIVILHDNGLSGQSRVMSNDLLEWLFKPRMKLIGGKNRLTSSVVPD
jgi:hypothetical protein